MPVRKRRSTTIEREARTEEEIRELESGLLPDELVMDMVRVLTTTQRLFLAGLGRGLAPVEAARRAGCSDDDAERMARVYMNEDPVLQPLSGHILRLRELSMLDGEEPVFPGTNTIQ